MALKKKALSIQNYSKYLNDFTKWLLSERAWHFGISVLFISAGEGSPSNMYKNYHWRYLPGNENMDEPKYVILDYIHHVQPQAKVLIIFRDPVDR